MDKPETAKPFVVLPFLPPTSNKIYVNGSHGRFLSSAAKEFKTRAVALIQRQCLAAIAALDTQGLYSIWYAFFFPKDELINKTFGQAVKNSAKTRYKRMDVENRLKLVSDSLSTAIGIDDSLFFEGGHTKACADMVGGTPQVQIFLTPQNPSKFGVG